MDSKGVNSAIRGEVRPLLIAARFERSTERTYCRYHVDRIDVINFQSFNSYNAGVLGITTYSFALNIGCYLKYIPDRYPTAPGRFMMSEWLSCEMGCHGLNSSMRRVPFTISWLGTRKRWESCGGLVALAVLFVPICWATLPKQR